MVSAAHTAAGVYIWLLPIPVPIKIVLLFLSHFGLDIFNEYYYTTDEPKWYLYAFVVVETIIAGIFGYAIITSHLSVLAMLAVIILPNLVDITEALYKAYQWVVTLITTGGVLRLADMKVLWGCHYRGVFPFKWSNAKIYHTPKVGVIKTVLTDLVLVVIAIILLQKG